MKRTYFFKTLSAILISSAMLFTSCVMVDGGKTPAENENPSNPGNTSGTGNSSDSGNTSGNGGSQTQTAPDISASINIYNPSSATKISWTGFTIAADKFALVEEDTKIVVSYIENTDTASYYKLKIADGKSSELYSGAFVNATIDLTSSNADNLHAVSLTYKPSSTVQKFAYTPSAAEWTKIKANGFKLYGFGFSVKAVNLDKQKSSSGNEGETGGSENSGSTENTGTESGSGESNAALSSLSSIQFAEKMLVGWNLGNTFDSAEYGNKTNKGENYETAWSMPKTTQAMINAVADKGFKTIRIPISWHNHITNGTNLTIDSKWLARVKEVVDWAIAKDMFVIINIHHDNLTSSEMSSTYGFSVNTKASENTASKNYIEKIWTQVATYFKDYDEHLIFELLNEPRDRDGNNNGFDASALSNGATLSAINAIISQYDQVALNAIRKTGGLNANRFVMAPYYAAQPWSDSGWSVPTDTATDKILIAVHAYDPYKFAMGDMSDTDFAENVEGAELTNLFTNCLKSKWTSKGYGVVMGEASCTDKNNLSDRLAWFESYITKAKAIKCPVILWDNMEVNDSVYDDVAECHGYFNRNNLTWYFPTLVEKMITTAGGTVGSSESDAGTSGSDSQTNAGTSIWSGSKDLKHWDGADGVTVSADKFASATSSSYIQITISKGAECSAISDGVACSNNYSVMQLITSWSNGNVKGTTNTAGASVNSENDQLVVTNIIPASETVTVNFTPSSWTSIKANGLIIYGHKVTINEIKLF